MNSEHLSPETYRRTVSAYHGLPVATALLFVIVFIGVVLLNGGYFLAAACAIIPSAFLLYRWVQAGRQIDRIGCSSCGEPLPKKLYWSYPPTSCPRCGNQFVR